MVEEVLAIFFYAIENASAEAAANAWIRCDNEHTNQRSAFWFRYTLYNTIDLLAKPLERHENSDHMHQIELALDHSFDRRRCDRCKNRTMSTFELRPMFDPISDGFDCIVEALRLSHQTIYYPCCALLPTNFYQRIAHAAFDAFFLFFSYCMYGLI
jgi:hypothetical protein